MVREDALGEQHLLRRERKEGKERRGAGRKESKKRREREHGFRSCRYRGRQEGSWAQLRAMLCAGTKPHRPMPRAALLQSAAFKD